MAFIQSQNIVGDLDGPKVAEIGSRVISEYEIDKNSRTKWEERIKSAMDLAMLVSEQKTYPWMNASNIKFPLLTTAALQFNARAYPAIVQGNRVAKCLAWGKDVQGIKAARAERVSEHLSYQLLSSPEWEDDTDKMLVILPIVGSVFRKVYFDPSTGRNCTRMVTADRLVVNYYARSLEDCPRITECMYLYPYEIEERIRSGRFAQFDYGPATASENDKEDDAPEGDEDAPHLFLEQHRLIDLDGDGYPEPYIVTVHHASQSVCRIVANYQADSVHVDQAGKVTAIRKADYYVQYTFLPSPDGGFYGWGFGWLLKDIGEAINTTTNMMLDSGHLSNVQGGLVSGLVGIKDKTIRLKPGEWKVVNTNMPLNQAVVPITYPGPSAVLFELLGMLVDSGKEVAAIKDVLTGDTPATAPVGTTMAIIEQGLQIFTSIYKRIHRSLKKELGLHAKLNREHLDPAEYAAFHDEGDGQPPADPKVDYNEKDMDILPVSDPNSVSKMQTLAKAMMLMDVAKKDMASGMPILDRSEVYRRVFEASQIEESEKLFAPPPQPNPEEEILKREVAKNAIEDQKAEILVKHTTALKNVADAESKEEGQQLAANVALLNHLSSKMEGQDGQGRVSGMEEQPGNAMGVQAPVADGGADGNALAGPVAPVDAGPPSGMGGFAGTGGA